MSGTEFAPLAFAPVPVFPDFSRVAMPEAVFNAVITQYGINLGWMRSHECPCTYAMGNRGSAAPGCQTCFGRGIYWEKPPLPFAGFLTFMHTSSAPDEPGAFVDADFGTELRAEPTLTIPHLGPRNESLVYADAGMFDAYVELDALARFTATFVVGKNQILPYDLGAVVETVTVFDVPTMTSQILLPAQYALNGGVMSIVGFAKGTAYTVAYRAQQVYVAFRVSGGQVHTRPFGLGQDNLPKRFRIVTLDAWTRSRFAGDGPASTETPVLAPVVPGATPKSSLLF